MDWIYSPQNASNKIVQKPNQVLQYKSQIYPYLLPTLNSSFWISNIPYCGRSCSTTISTKNNLIDLIWKENTKNRRLILCRKCLRKILTSSEEKTIHKQVCHSLKDIWLCITMVLKIPRRKWQLPEYCVSFHERYRNETRSYFILFSLNTLPYYFRNNIIAQEDINTLEHCSSIKKGKLVKYMEKEQTCKLAESFI